MLQAGYKSVKDSPDEISKRHQLLRRPVEPYPEAGFNSAKTEGNTLLAVFLVANVILQNHSKEDSG